MEDSNVFGVRRFIAAFEKIQSGDESPHSKSAQRKPTGRARGFCCLLASLYLFPPVRQGEFIELQLLEPVARVREELLQEIGDEGRVEPVEVMLAVAAEADQVAHAQERQVMADGRLRLLQKLAQGGDVQFALLGQIQQYFEPGLIGEQFEDFREAFD